MIDHGSEIPSFLHLKTDKYSWNITFTEKDMEMLYKILIQIKLMHMIWSAYACSKLAVNL